MNAIDNFLSDNIDFSEGNKGLRMYVQLEEAQKIDISDKVVSALYKSALDKSYSVNYGNIPESKGDITRLSNYKTMKESLDMLTAIMKDNEDLATVKESFKILEAYKKEFTLCFMQNKMMGILLYNNIVLGIIAGIDVCITASINYLRTPGSDLKDMVKSEKDSKSNKSLILMNLKEFNNYANSGDLKKYMNLIISKDNFIGAVAAVITITGASLVLVIGAVYIMRRLIYCFYNIRMDIAEYLRLQELFLEINIRELNTKDIKNKKVIIKKQENAIKKLESLANKIEVKFAEADKKTSKDLSKKIKASTIEESLPSDVTII